MAPCMRLLVHTISLVFQMTWHTVIVKVASDAVNIYESKSLWLSVSITMSIVYNVIVPLSGKSRELKPTCT
jgi:hypothetical protein